MVKTLLSFSTFFCLHILVIAQSGTNKGQSKTFLFYDYHTHKLIGISNEGEIKFNFESELSFGFSGRYYDRRLFKDDVEIISSKRFNKRYNLINNKGQLLAENTPYKAIGFVSEGLFPLKLRDKFGYSNLNGELIIPETFSSAYPFFEGQAAVFLKDSLGFINSKGEFTIPLSFSRMEIGYPYIQFSNGLCKLPYNQKYGFLDKNGDWKIKPKYREASHFNSDGVAVVCDELCGFIDMNEEYIISPKYLSAENFIGEMALVQDAESKLFGYIDKKGNYLIPAKFYKASSFVDGLAVVVTDADQPSKKSVINAKGEILFSENAKRIWVFNQNVIQVITRQDRILEYYICNYKKELIYKSKLPSSKPANRGNFIGESGIMEDTPVRQKKNGKN